jgi:hypothetical protein
MFEFSSALFQGDPLLQAIADDEPAPGGGLTRISRGQNPLDPAVMKVQLALLDWRPDCLPRFGADGEFGEEAEIAVHSFKLEELAVPEEEIINDVGPLTVQRLDAIRAAVEAPEPEPVGTVAVFNQYGEPLAGISLVVEEEGAESLSSTDGEGRAALAIAGQARVTLDPSSVLAALGDLLERPGETIEAGEAAVVTPAGGASLFVEPGTELRVMVAARIDLTVPMLAPLEGAPRVEGPGVMVGIDGESVRLSLQAAGGSAAAVVLDPPPSEGVPVEMPPLTPWVLPDGYVVQDGDTEASLATRFFDDPDAFASLSDHPPVAGETLRLPAEAVPGWVATASAPLPDPPLPEVWASVAPDAVLAAVYENGDQGPLQELIASLEAPPAAAEDPVAVAAARAGAIAAFLALGAEGGVAEARPKITEPAGTGPDEFPG